MQNVPSSRALDDRVCLVCICEVAAARMCVPVPSNLPRTRTAIPSLSKTQIPLPIPKAHVPAVKHDTASSATPPHVLDRTYAARRADGPAGVRPPARMRVVLRQFWARGCDARACEALGLAHRRREECLQRRQCRSGRVHRRCRR
ncbi:hypothetical protein B0H19DRAFT_1156474 [Mycena capillaripes]|nr:hypothetical protein B0H19DRAFT_1156474 [Mycena capillaripes]